MAGLPSEAILEWLFTHRIKVNFHFNSITKKQELIVTFSTGRDNKFKHVWQHEIAKGANLEFLLFEFLRFAKIVDPKFPDIFK
jgi:hypothetical protein